MAANPIDWNNTNMAEALAAAEAERDEWKRAYDEAGVGEDEAHALVRTYRNATLRLHREKIAAEERATAAEEQAGQLKWDYDRLADYSEAYHNAEIELNGLTAQLAQARAELGRLKKLLGHSETHLHGAVNIGAHVPLDWRIKACEWCAALDEQE